MQEIKSLQELNSMLEAPRLIVASMQRGCVPCAAVTPLLELLDRTEGIVAARVDSSMTWFSERFGVEGSPIWLTFDGGRETGRIAPAGKTPEALADFFNENLHTAPEITAMKEALAQGKKQAEYVESCLAELAFRSADTGEEMLMASLRLKVFEGCLESPEGLLELCVDAQILRLSERLKEKMLQPGGDTPVRRQALEGLTAMAPEYVRGIQELREQVSAKTSTASTP